MQKLGAFRRTCSLSAVFLLCLFTAFYCPLTPPLQQHDDEYYWTRAGLFFKPQSDWDVQDMGTLRRLEFNPPGDTWQAFVVEMESKKKFPTLESFAKRQDERVPNYFRGELEKLPEKSTTIAGAKAVFLYYRMKDKPEIGWYSCCIDSDEDIIHVWWQGWRGEDRKSFKECAEEFEEFVSNIHGN